MVHKMPKSILPENFVEDNEDGASPEEWLGKIPSRDWLYEIPGYTPHIVIKFREDMNLPYTDDDEDLLEKDYGFPWHELKGEFENKIDLQRLFVSLEPEQLRGMVRDAKEQNNVYTKPFAENHFLTFYRIDVPPDVSIEKLLEHVSDANERTPREEKPIEYVYFDPPSGDPAVNASDDLPNAPLQTYLKRAPGGIEVEAAWKTGADGSGEVFLDFEQGWALDHQDLAPLGGGLSGPGGNFNDSRPHGTAVLGIVCGKDNTQGIIGIAPNATANVVSYWGATSRADALKFAIAKLKAGDVLLIEAEILPAGLPCELVPAERDAIKTAIDRNIIVIEAAGNGSKSLSSFPDCGAIMVGSTEDSLRNGQGHDRLGTSNTGSRINCYAWGRNVTTAWADTAGNAMPNEYTDCLNDPQKCFSGTSSAAAIIAGMAVLIQSIRRNGPGTRFKATEMRDLLCDPNNGTPIFASGNWIGTMPDFAKIVPVCLEQNPFGI